MTILRMMRQVLRHPYDFYYDIQEPGRLKWHQGIIVVLLTFVAKMASILITGYAFETREPYQISSIHEFIWIVVPWLTWCISNWGVSAILDGEGKFKEVFVGSAFALVPYVLFIIPVTLLTNILTLGEGSTYHFLNAAIICWVAWLFLVKVKIVHDFEPGKLIMITLLSLLGIAIIWFIGILLFGLMNQFVNFFVDMVKELKLH
jgi:hypothetical protein